MDIFPPSGNYSMVITNQLDISTCAIYSILIITNQMDRKCVSQIEQEEKENPLSLPVRNSPLQRIFYSVCFLHFFVLKFLKYKSESSFH